MQNKLLDNIWESEKYYTKISSLEKFDHPGLKETQKLSLACHKILDVGCGDGSKLSKLGNKRSQLFGCDISNQALALGKKKFPNITFKLQTETKLPFADQDFDLVTSFFVLEHTDNPKLLILDMLRVTKTEGLLIFLAPNFGAPNRASPNFKGNRYQKLLSGFISDLVRNDALAWNKVIPGITKIADFEPDLDTTIEPYVRSLIDFIKKYSDIIEAKSFWGLDEGNLKPLQKFFLALGQQGIYPFKFWGPHLFLIVKKTT